MAVCQPPYKLPCLCGWEVNYRDKNIGIKHYPQTNPLLTSLREYIDSRNITKYHLSPISGVPKTVIMDIYSSKSSLQKCSANTIQQLAKALDCPMEYIMSLDVIDTGYDKETGC